ncbi:MAG: hypothetical protein JWN46_417 [Acidimicrobiales bacterium]|nr:hypothetical protein [Acidimicrobiales bacterium]
MSPAPRAVWLLGLIAAAAFFVPVGLVALAAGFVVVATLVDAWFARRPPAAERTLPTDVARGVPNAFAVTVHAAPGTRADVRQPQTADVRFTPSIGRGGLTGTFTARRRGRHRLEPVAVRVHGPLGLGRWDHAVGGEVDVRSHPDLPGARRLAVAVRRGRFRDPGLRPGELGLGTEFETVRDYAPEDDVRRINWAATERVGRPMANQYREDTERDLWCLIDAGRLMTAPIDERTRLDVALDVVAAVAAVADAVGDRVGAVAFDAEVRRSLPPRRSGGEGLLRALYDLEPRPVDSDHDLAFHRVGSAKRALVVVCTDLLEEAASGPLLEAMPVLVRHHAVLVVTAADPDLVRAVTVDPLTAVDVHAASVADDLLAARDRVVRSLGTLGCVVVDAAPDRLPSAAVAAYLTLKSRARL